MQGSVNLGVMYDNGDGVPENDAEAVKWYRKAADQGHASAQYNLGVMYSNGEGVPENDAEAVKWYRKAADQGNAMAQHQPRPYVLAMAKVFQRIMFALMFGFLWLKHKAMRKPKKG